MYKKYIKRLLDIFFAVLFLPILCFFIIIIGPVIYFEDKGSIFYLAKRRGLGGKVFLMYKFRTMKVNAPDLRNADNSTYNSQNDPRVTKIGKILRKTSIDEIPQIINILKGDMSWIGPRAPIPRGDDNLIQNDLSFKRRFDVRPGITGYSAALYRNSISSEEKKKLDCFYADNVSFLLDLKIILWTVKTVIRRKNIYRNDEQE